jgi:hypothetical protein
MTGPSGPVERLFERRRNPFSTRAAHLLDVAGNDEIFPQGYFRISDGAGHGDVFRFTVIRSLLALVMISAP